MKDWKKENRCMMEIFYWFDINGKIESGSVEGERMFLNVNSADDFYTLKTKENEIVSISKGAVYRIDYKQVPDWFIISEEMVVESAKFRKKEALHNLHEMKDRLKQEQEMNSLKDRNINGSV